LRFCFAVCGRCQHGWLGVFCTHSIAIPEFIITGVIGRLNKRVKAFDKRVEDKSDEITQRVLDSWAFAFLGPMCRICFYLVAIWIAWTLTPSVWNQTIASLTVGDIAGSIIGWLVIVALVGVFLHFPNFREDRVLYQLWVFGSSFLAGLGFVIFRFL
jgi:hypothetical protein